MSSIILDNPEIIEDPIMSEESLSPPELADDDYMDLASERSLTQPPENTPRHNFDDAEDEQMRDAASSPAGEAEDDDVVDDDEDEEEDGGRDSEPPSVPTTPVPEVEAPPRKRRLGRPPKNKPPGWDDDVGRASDAGTPRGRGRGRGGFRGGGRWKNRGGPSHVTQQPIDKEGNMMNVVDDEVDLPEDEEGEKKVDKMGHLQDGREYRCRTFTIPGREERLYMLSTEPARCVGFRDSYLFFSKHKKLYKIIISDDEKLEMIERELIPHSYKGRAIGICTARSVFREFGARIIVGGKRVIDDYEVAAAKADGVIEGELADPNDVLPKPGEPYNKNQYVAWHGASAVYHGNQSSVPLAAGKAIQGQKRRVMINDMNWKLEHARAAWYVEILLKCMSTNMFVVTSMLDLVLFVGGISMEFMIHTPMLCSTPSLCSQPTRDGSKLTTMRLKPVAVSLTDMRRMARPVSSRQSSQFTLGTT